MKAGVHMKGRYMKAGICKAKLTYKTGPQTLSAVRLISTLPRAILVSSAICVRTCCAVSRTEQHLQLATQLRYHFLSTDAPYTTRTDITRTDMALRYDPDTNTGISYVAYGDRSMPYSTDMASAGTGMAHGAYA
eukprot:1034957-Rhodomonas_salina.1